MIGKVSEEDFDKKMQNTFGSLNKTDPLYQAFSEAKNQINDWYYLVDKLGILTKEVESVLTKEDRIAAAKQRILGRTPDRDDAENEAMFRAFLRGDFPDDKLIYTEEEVLRKLMLQHAVNPKLFGGKSYEEVIEPFEESGFLCIHNFLKLECGWVISHEEICSLCVDHLVDEFGSDNEKEMLAWVRNLE
ncbi:hypothetical protein NVP1170O_182 [Vibrio phage 1.170.O._10N.261.52.C3]|nr:hypothetical protein NVP1170O_182 [Vibrio phage 1.170.O._10N.261.52.C3]